jgi:hypothetical protein
MLRRTGTPSWRIRIRGRRGDKFHGPPGLSVFTGWSQPVNATLYLEGEMECALMGDRFHRGFTAAEKRHLLVDTLDLLLHASRYPGSRRRHPPEFHTALTKLLPQLETQIIKRSDHAKDSWCFPAVGLSSAPSPGSTAAEGLPRIGRTSIARRWHSCASHQSASCSENFVIPLDVPGQTLTRRKCA